MFNAFRRGIEKKYIPWVPGLGAHANYSFLEMYAILDYTYLPRAWGQKELLLIFEKWEGRRRKTECEKGVE